MVNDNNTDDLPCTNYEFTPIASFVTNAPIWTIVPTKSWKWVFTGSSDGRIVKYDMIDTLLGKTMLTQLQRSGLAETVSKGGHVLNLWFNHDTKETQDHWLASRTQKPSPTRLATATTEPATNDMDIESNADPPPTASETKPKPATPPPPAAAYLATQIPPPTIPDISPVYCLATHSEGQWVAAGTHRGGIALYTARHDEGTQFACLPQHTDVVSALLVTHAQDQIISGSWDSSLCLSDLNTGECVSRYKETISTVASISAHPTDTNVFLVASLNGSTSQWDLRCSPTDGPAVIFNLPPKTPPWTQSACYNPISGHVYIGRRIGTVDEYASSGAYVRTLTQPKNSGQVTRVYCMPNGRSLLVGSADIVRQWDLNHQGKGVPFTIIPGQGAHVADFAVDPESRYMICTTGNRGWESSVKESALALVFSMTKMYD